MYVAYSSWPRQVVGSAATRNGCNPSAMKKAPGLHRAQSPRAARAPWNDDRCVRPTARPAHMWESVDTTQGAIIFPPGLSSLLVCGRDSKPASGPDCGRLGTTFPAHSEVRVSTQPI